MNAGPTLHEPERREAPEPALITVVVAAVSIVALVLLLIVLWGMNGQ